MFINNDDIKDTSIIISIVLNITKLVAFTDL